MNVKYIEKNEKGPKYEDCLMDDISKETEHTITRKSISMKSVKAIGISLSIAAVGFVLCFTYKYSDVLKDIWISHYDPPAWELIHKRRELRIKMLKNELQPYDEIVHQPLVKGQGEIISQAYKEAAKALKDARKSMNNKKVQGQSNESEM